MATGKGGTQDAGWPMPTFSFTVDFGSLVSNARFQEISGLDTASQAIEYRGQDSKTFSVIKMPGIAKTGNITLKKGIFVNDDSFRNWYNRIKMNTAERAMATIRLLDETARPVMTWTLENAWVTRISGTESNEDQKEIAVETIELTHGGLTIANK